MLGHLRNLDLSVILCTLSQPCLWGVVFGVFHSTKFAMTESFEVSPINSGLSRLHVDSRLSYYSMMVRRRRLMSRCLISIIILWIHDWSFWVGYSSHPICSTENHTFLEEAIPLPFPTRNVVTCTPRLWSLSFFLLGLAPLQIFVMPFWPITCQHKSPPIQHMYANSKPLEFKVHQRSIFWQTASKKNMDICYFAYMNF